MTALSRSLTEELCRQVRAARPHPDALPLAVDAQLDRLAPLLAGPQRLAVHTDVLARLTGLGALAPYLLDEAVTEVAVNGGREVWIDRGGPMEHVATLPAGEVDTLVERIIGPLGLRFDRASPIVDARLADGARLCAVMAPLAVDGTCVSIRRFALRHVTLDAFAQPAVAGLVADLVGRHSNLVVSGATSSGKTTLLNAIAGRLPAGERVITIEDTAELRLASPHVVRLEARRATADGVTAVTVSDLVRAALRLRPDRLVIGEVRGVEAVDLLQALNTGHDGSLATVHANHPHDAVRRIASLAAHGSPGHPLDAVVEQVRSCIDAVVHVARAADGRRRIVEVAEVEPPGSPGLVRVLAAADEVVAGPTRRRGATWGPS